MKTISTAAFFILITISFGPSKSHASNTATTSKAQNAQCPVGTRPVPIPFGVICVPDRDDF